MIWLGLRLGWLLWGFSRSEKDEVGSVFGLGLSFRIEVMKGNDLIVLHVAPWYSIYKLMNFVS